MRALLLLVAAGCAPDPCADVDLDGGLELTPDNHEAGWGREPCSQCHVAATLHTAGCLPDGAVDLEALQAADDTEPCASCHGDNGLDVDTGVWR